MININRTDFDNIGQSHSYRRNGQHQELTRFDKTRDKSPDPQKKQHSTGNYRERGAERINMPLITTASNQILFQDRITPCNLFRIGILKSFLMTNI